MHEYLLDNGMTREEYHFFLDDNLRHHCIMGNDFYHTNEHRVDADGGILPAGEVFGYDEITRQYHDRYGLPVMHTETNFDQGHGVTRRSTGCGSSGPTSCACATTACPSSASPGTRSRTRSTGTSLCASSGAR